MRLAEEQWLQELQPAGKVWQEGWPKEASTSGVEEQLIVGPGSEMLAESRNVRERDGTSEPVLLCECSGAHAACVTSTPV